MKILSAIILLLEVGHGSAKGFRGSTAEKKVRPSYFSTTYFPRRYLCISPNLTIRGVLLL